ncbi:unannotated protein [freshwater metagenome]|uniref:Unannotated protein n=1 Tax=freshwater metagenome TaxID=449393 RepID=A0A6J6RXT7_9ZZZZ
MSRERVDQVRADGLGGEQRVVHTHVRNEPPLAATALLWEHGSPTDSGNGPQAVLGLLRGDEEAIDLQQVVDAAPMVPRAARVDLGKVTAAPPRSAQPVAREARGVQLRVVEIAVCTRIGCNDLAEGAVAVDGLEADGVGVGRPSERNPAGAERLVGADDVLERAAHLGGRVADAHRDRW